jgi:hypothetical protein
VGTQSLLEVVEASKSREGKSANEDNEETSGRLPFCDYQLQENSTCLQRLAIVLATSKKCMFSEDFGLSEGFSAASDNLRLTVFEGNDFAAEAIKVEKPPTIDGDLGDWDGRGSIPLVGRNQLHFIDNNYDWTPKNLSGVAYLRWEAKNLYVAIDVVDDIHHPAGDGDSVTEGDCVIV